LEINISLDAVIEQLLEEIQAVKKILVKLAYIYVITYIMIAMKHIFMLTCMPVLCRLGF